MVAFLLGQPVAQLALTNNHIILLPHGFLGGNLSYLPYTSCQFGISSISSVLQHITMFGIVQQLEGLR